MRPLSSFILAMACLGVAHPGLSQTINSQESATPYAEVRGWTVSVMGDGRGIFSCRASVGTDYMNQMMVEYNGFSESWRLYVRGNRPEPTGFGIKAAILEFDGAAIDRQVGFGLSDGDGASNSHAHLDFTADELKGFMTGAQMHLDINDEAPRTFALKGTTAAVLKVEECASSYGFAPVLSAQGFTASSAPAQGTPTAPKRVDGYNVGYVLFDTGHYRHVGGLDWLEESDGLTVPLVEVERAVDFVVLNDPAQNAQIWIAMTDGIIRYTQNFNYNAWQDGPLIDCYDVEMSKAC